MHYFKNETNLGATILLATTLAKSMMIVLHVIL